jgi:hypothetical protein
MAPSTPPTRPSHLTHDELDAVSRQRQDCAAVGRTLRLERPIPAAPGARAVPAGPPGPEEEDYQAEVAPRDVRITPAAAALADALHLHMD